VFEWNDAVVGRRLLRTAVAEAWTPWAATIPLAFFSPSRVETRMAMPDSTPTPRSGSVCLPLIRQPRLLYPSTYQPDFASVESSNGPDERRLPATAGHDILVVDADSR